MQFLYRAPAANAGAGARLPARRPTAALICILALAGLLAACDGQGTAKGAPKDAPHPTSESARPALVVRAMAVTVADRATSVSLTGDVEAKVLTQLSFRVGGRVTERLVDVGAHVAAGDLLARVDPTEQQADLDAATAAVSAAESRLRVATSNLDRQSTLLAKGYTTRAAYDQATETAGAAESALETARAQLGTARDALGYAELRARAAGVITARTLEVGQVVQPAQSVFTLAEDGTRDAVFDVYETFFRNSETDRIRISLVSDPKVAADGRVREVSPVIDASNGTVRVKVAIDAPADVMALGSPVTGTVTWKATPRIVLPWSALASDGGSPAVWRIDPKTRAVSLAKVAVEAFETGSIVISSGLAPGDLVVVDGAKRLSTGQTVDYTLESGS